MPENRKSCNILRCHQVVKKTGLSRHTLYRLDKAGFLKKRKISPGAVGWIESEVDDYLASCG